jgi:tetratricopeptide (TPR) repeat protein
MVIRLAILAAAIALSAPANAQVYTAYAAGSPARNCFEGAMQRNAQREALYECDRAIARANLTQNELAKTHINRGIILINIGHADEALDDFSRADEIDPTLMPESATNRSAALILLERYAEAVEAADYAVAAGTNSRANALFNRGVALELLGDIRSAYESYRDAAEVAPDWSRPREALDRFQVHSLS